MTLLRNVLLIAGLALGATTQAAHAQAATKLDLGPAAKITAAIPQGWQQNEGIPPTFFQAGKNGSIQFLATQMPMPEATYRAMHKAALDAGKAKIKTGEYIKAEERTIDGFKGVLTLESARDPNIRRLQWQAYGRGAYFNFTLASPTPNFEGYLPTYETVLESIKFVK